MKKYPFDLRSYNPYDLHCRVKDHYARVQFNWIHVACHWAKEDPWRYCYNSSRVNEPVGFVVEWLAKKHEAAPRRALEATIAIEVNILVRNKGKRNIVDQMEEE